MNVPRDDENDEDRKTYKDFWRIQQCFTYKDSPPYFRHYRCIDMLGHINEGENEQKTIALISVFVIIF